MEKRYDFDDAESLRLLEEERREQNWKRWGPYLSERQWGTVREDYSADGNVWGYFPHDHARSRAYRWGEDGLLGITDRQCRLCFSLALWNGNDTILKERLFGLTGPEGNHGEDVKEEYFYLDSTPTHSYMKALYKYPQARFPYRELVAENARRGLDQREYELADTGVFDDNRYFDVYAEYAKASADDVLIRITAVNRGPEAAPIHVLPTLWARNSWVWGCSHEGCEMKPHLAAAKSGEAIVAEHETLGRFQLDVDLASDGALPPLLFTDNHTNSKKLFGTDNATRHVKDAFHDWLIDGKTEAVNPKQCGTKAAAVYGMTLGPGEQRSIKLRLRKVADPPKPGEIGVPREEAPPIAEPLGEGFDAIFKQRIAEADAFYEARIYENLSDEQKAITRQAYAGMLWSKQHYHFIVEDWLEGDEHQPTPPASRKQGRNNDWPHLYNRDVISMPDKWEYPWYAAWDLAFHMIPFARIDPHFAKRQLTLFLREWYMHPNGQIPAYEFNFSDVNPPVHAWAVWRVYKMTGPKGQRDRKFLASCFQKLLLNFTWWVNRKDRDGNHLFHGGFLGLDNIGVFDRSQELPGGAKLDQADGTAWMAFYCGTMLAMAKELALEDEAYGDLASKFFEHFLAIADAMNTLGGDGLWDEEDGFYYDQMHQPTGDGGQVTIPLKVRSLVGLMPLMASDIIEESTLETLTGFARRMRWFVRFRNDLVGRITYCDVNRRDGKEHMLLAIPSPDRLRRVLTYMLDENEFLSPFGIRSMSKVHEQKPFTLQLDGKKHSVGYTPGESTTSMFGGNSNWRGPIWFPINYLLIESLERYHYFFGDSFKIECPTGSGNEMTLREVATELTRRLANLFERNADGHRPAFGDDTRFARCEHRRDLLWFHEYFHGDTGRGLGASHQTGWTGLIATCYDKLARRDAVGE